MVRIFAISDMHLDFANGKTMDMFGEHWHEHPQRLEKNWRSKINSDDIVLIPGDISWAMSMEEADKDLSFIGNLPGRKVLCPGNHDYWWKSTSRLNEKYDNMFFLKNSFFACDDMDGYAVCGCRGWVCPNDKLFTQQDSKLYARQAARLRRSLDMAIHAGYRKIIVMMHYSPVNDKSEPSEFTKLIFSYPVHKVVYGHWHKPIPENPRYMGIVDGVEFTLVSGDSLDFDPVRIL